MFRKLATVLLLSGIAILPLRASPPSPQSSQATAAHQPAQAPLTIDEVIKLIKQGTKNLQQVASTIAERGVDFDLDAKAEKKLRKAGADDQMLPEIWKATPSGKAHMQAALTTPTGVEVQASAGEALSLQELQDESDADRRIRMADEFEKKFPGSALLSYVYTVAAKAHQEKGEFEGAIQDGQKSLKLDPDNTFSLIIMALVLPQPNSLKVAPKEGGQRLVEAEADANRALTLLEKLKPRPGETDEQFQQRKGALAADAHFALGMAETQQDQFEEALAQYQTAISSTSKPTFQYYYRLAEAYASIGRVPEAIDTLQKASDLARGTPMQKYADDFMAELRQRGH